MCPIHSPERLCEMERAVLRALCQPSLPDTLRQRLSQKLAAYQWQAADHRIIFAALQRIRNTRTSSLQEQLPAHATRMGFPDIHWAAFFEPDDRAPEIEKLVSALNVAAKPW
jgi:hypothetical protein